MGVLEALETMYLLQVYGLLGCYWNVLAGAYPTSHVILANDASEKDLALINFASQCLSSQHQFVRYGD